eukprot:scaffold318346_cov28-Tisochrysis_lutea.AAC.2
MPFAPARHHEHWLVRLWAASSFCSRAGFPRLVRVGISDCFGFIPLRLRLRPRLHLVVRRINSKKVRCKPRSWASRRPAAP